MSADVQSSDTAPRYERSSWPHLLFSFRGRISRWTYVTRVLLVFIVIQCLAVLGLAFLIQLADAGGNDWLFRSTILFLLAVLAVALWISFAVVVKRLHDRRRSGWMALLSLVPFVNFWIAFETMFLRGRNEENPYGAPETKETSSRAIAIALGLTALVLSMFSPVTGLARVLILQPFNIPSSGEQPTLFVGDYIFVSKSAYGYSRYSFPFGLVPISSRIFASAPTRGDIVVFKFKSADYIKRIIGLPGDRIQMKDGVLYINETAVPKVKVDDYTENNFGRPRRVPQYRETLPNGVSYDVLDLDPQGNLDNTEVFVVPEGHYFMMGDNRDNSDDSRASVGYVPFENFVGKAELVYYSENGSARIWEFWKWPQAVRYDRIGRYIR